MSYAELLQAWRAGVLPVRNLAGTRREAPQAPNGGNLPAIPVLPATKTEGEQKPEPAPKRAEVDNLLSAPVLALVRCGQCRHFEPNANNPRQGLGRCDAGAEGERLPWPNAPRHCATWNPAPAALLEICRAACDGLAVEPEALACWLEAQGDNGWLVPIAVHRWAREIARQGYPEKSNLPNDFGKKESS